MIFSGKTDIGRRRKVNQDTFAHAAISPDADLFVVCDGMGGAFGGAEASRIACDTFCSVMRDALPEIIADAAVICSDAEAIAARRDRLFASIPDALERAAAEANRAVFETAAADSTLQGMGTTLVALLVWGEYACAINIGDSRLYAITAEQITQISHDHSYVQYLVDLGKLPPEEARTNANRNIITRAVGTAESVEADIFLIDPSLVGQAVFLLCSDGLTGMLTDGEIAELVRRADSVEEAVEVLVARANAAGGTDNITAVLCR